MQLRSGEVKLPRPPGNGYAVCMGTIETSILMAVYHGDDRRALAASLDSLANQTLPPEQIVLVRDGPVGDDLQHVIDTFESTHPGWLTQVILRENQGLVAALNRGIDACHGELVLRMDADDIAHPERIERQVAWMDAHPDVGVLGTAMTEFTDDPAMAAREKPVKEEHDEIVRQLPWRNPVNHPTVCIRRTLLADGYPDLEYLEDYFLWAQLIARGVRFHNLPLALVSYRFDDTTFIRRSGWLNFRNEVALRWWMVRHGLSGPATFIAAACLQVVLRFGPRTLQRALWHGVRRPVNGP